MTNNILDLDSEVQTKSKYLLKFGWLSGLIPLIGGWTIFFVWLICATLNIKEGINTLPFIGFYWIIICFFIAIAGLISLVLYSIINRNNLHLEISYALLVILVNIPCVFLIIYLFEQFGGMG